MILVYSYIYNQFLELLIVCFVDLLMKNFLPLFSFIMIADVLFAQTFRVKINLFDVQTKVVIENASVNLSEKYFSTSNNAGEIIFDKIPTGKYSLYISHISYSVFNEVIGVYSDTSLIFQMTPTEIRLNEVIIISSKYEKDIKEIPYAVSIVDESFIKKNPSITIADLLKNESFHQYVRKGGFLFL